MLKDTLKKMGFNIKEKPVETPKSQNEIDLEKLMQFSGKMKAINEKLQTCKRLKRDLLKQEEDNLYYLNMYSNGWDVNGHSVRSVVDMDEIYTFIYTKVKESEEKLQAQLKEYATGCVLAQ